MVAVVAGASAVLGFATPALAQSNESWYRVGGTEAQRNTIDLGVSVSLYDDLVSLKTDVMFGSAATSATGCKITGWLILRNWGQTSTWEGPRNTFDCRYSLDTAGTAIVHWWQNWSGYTSAQGASGRVCVDLYYNGSSSSGWQRCYTGPVVWEN
ncbi:hypothetical protein [Micromonospora sp. NBS 11-29]|uniref:hypothetical protein n=1 Tax=Micromonospora sp. NBS 11-29 TaxID=1960879 RepID=UPI000B7728BE|nr:hypothetical protein [Micromonospora sp. NBS 11-29]